METRSFGRAAQTISVLTYGAMRVNQERDTAPEIIHALEQGITAIDTARAYGNSERIVGATLKAWTGPKPFISTKVRPYPGDWRFYCPLETAFTPESMRKDVETSLKNLGVDVLDLVYLHQWYALWTHRPEWLDTFRALKQEGKIRAFGISAQDHEHDALLQVVDAGLVDAVQVIINLFESRPFTSLVPLCRERHVGVMARCVLDDGRLTGALTDADFARAGGHGADLAAPYQRRLNALRQRFCADGTSLSELAIRFVLSHPGVSTLTMSMPDPRLVDMNLAAAAKGPLAPADFEAIRREFVWTKNFYEPRCPAPEPKGGPV